MFRAMIMPRRRRLLVVMLAFTRPSDDFLLGCEEDERDEGEGDAE